MAIQIINCPACGTFLLDDTAGCHACGHVLRAHEIGAAAPTALPTDQAVDDDMEICATCGESCRKGLVRCWNCGSFTRPEIEAAYRQRSDSSSVVGDRDFDLPELDASMVTEEDSMQRRSPSTPEDLLAAPPMAREEDDGMDDFELSEDVTLSESDDSAFDLSDTFQLQADAPAESTGYSLGPVPDVPTAPATPAAEMDTIPLLSNPAAAEEGNPFATGAPAQTPAKAETPAPTPEDELLKIAADEEAEISQVKKGMRSKNSFVVFCPQGHRIRVREKFRGKTGKCPKCMSVFIVPQKSSPKPEKKTDVEIPVAGAAGAAPTGRYARWLDDVHLHQVIPEKLKIKADSLLNEFQGVDLGFSAEEILLVTLVTSAGLFGSVAKKKPTVRAAMLEYFQKADASPDSAPVATKRVMSRDTLGQLLLVQPVPTGMESLFGSIPVFGTGRIAVRLPRLPDEKATPYLSFTLSEFRAFSQALQTVCGIEAFGTNSEIPLSDTYQTFKCHYSENPVRALQHLDYYQKDPAIKLEISGWKCGTCGLIVSEDARKKEKIGGLNGKGIAKAKCPKCSQKFGSNPMYVISEPAAPVAADAAPVTESAGG